MLSRRAVLTALTLPEQRRQWRVTSTCQNLSGSGNKGALAGAAEIAPRAGIGPDGNGGVVWVHGLAGHLRPGRRGRGVAAVGRGAAGSAGAASQRQVAAAFGKGPVMAWPRDSALRGHGVAGQVPARKGPKRPSKLTGELAGRIRALDGGGQPLAEIAAACGVSVFTVRSALGRVRPRGQEPSGREPGTGEQEQAAGDAGSAGDEPAGREPGGQDLLPVAGGSGGPGHRAGTGPVRAARGGRHAGVHRRGSLLRWPGCWPVPGRFAVGCARRFYGLAMTLLTLVFLALLREPRAEGATRIDVAAVGRVLGLDRAPEVKTIRRKLGELAAKGRAAELQMAIARHHAQAHPRTELTLRYEAKNHAGTA